MKKIILLLIGLVLCFWACSSVSKLSTIVLAGLKGPVKSIKVITTYYQGNKPQLTNQEWDTEHVYDKKGALIEQKAWKPTGQLTYRRRFEHDADSKLLEETVYDSKNKLDRAIQYKYDSLGNKAVVYTFNGGGQVIEKQTYSYDEKGNEIYSDYVRMGRMITYNKAFYNNDNRLIRNEKYHKDAVLEQVYHYTYSLDNHAVDVLVVDGDNQELMHYKELKDAEGQLVEYNKFHKGDTLPYRTKTYKWDKAGNEIAYHSYVLGKLASKRLTTYNKQGQVVTFEEEKAKGVFKKKELYRYDKKGNRIESLVYNGQDTIPIIKSWHFQYDKYKNWTERRFYQDEMLEEVTIRKISYHK